MNGYEGGFQALRFVAHFLKIAVLIPAAFIAFRTAGPGRIAFRIAAAALLLNVTWSVISPNEWTFYMPGMTRAAWLEMTLDSVGPHLLELVAWISAAIGVKMLSDDRAESA